MFRRDFSLFNTKDTAMKKTLEREIKLARNIQMKLLNGERPSMDHGNISGVSIPARLIGGDYYDFYLLPNGKLRIVIGDVMGKGIPAAMLMILTRGAFRSAAESTQGPGDTVTAMNNAMYKDLRTLGSFVTLFCADWDPIAQTLVYANAGHNTPIVASSRQKVNELPRTKGVMLGGLPNQTYPEMYVKLGNKDVVLFYTDGIIEAQNKKGEMYRIDRLKNILLKNFCNDVNQIENEVVNSIENFIDEVPQKDDITLVLLKVSPENTNITSYNSPIINS